VRDALPISLTGSSVEKRLSNHESIVPITALPASIRRRLRTRVSLSHQQ
jgi:hypothetical protein